MPDINSDCWEIFVVQEHNGKQFGNVFNVVDLSGSYDEDGIADQVESAWTAADSFIDCQVQDVTYIETRVSRSDGSSAQIVRPWQSSDNNGNVVGDPVDPGSCLGFTLRTNAPGRSGRGRLYLGGVGRGALDAFSTSWDLGSSPGSTFKFAAQTFASELSGSNLIMIIVSRYLNKVLRDTPIFNTVNAWVARSSILSQNPRARRYGTV